MISENPWKGLNYYREGETLYGRSIEIERLSTFIVNNTQTVLFGKSGIGKSSIINAGIFPISRKQGLYPISIRLEHDDRNGYVSQIKAAFEKSGINIREDIPAIDNDTESIWEYLHRNSFYLDNEHAKPVRPLIVFDQFEEIFTLQRNEQHKKEFFAELADLINEVMPQYILDHQKTDVSKDTIGKSFSLDFGNDDEVEYTRSSNFNMVFVIREDFLSYLERYTLYIPAMKSNRFPLQTINELQAREIITKPSPGLVDDDVAKLIISKVTGCSHNEIHFDRIPEMEVDSAVLSLFLSRLYLKKPENERSISAEIVNAYSEDIIKDFYEETTSKIAEDKLNYLEDKLVNKEGRRENISRFKAKDEGLLSDQDLDYLINEEKLIRQFSYGGDLRIEFIHDILCPIVKERKEQRESRIKQEKEKLLLIEKQKKDKRKLMTFIFAMFGVILIIGVYYAINWYTTSFVHEEYYLAFEENAGWPVGIGEPLSEADRLRSPLYYRLSHKGSVSHHTDVAVLSSNESLPLGKPRISSLEYNSEEKSDTLAINYNNVINNIAEIHYITNEDGRIGRKEYTDATGKVMLIVSYFHLNDNDAWANYLNSAGHALEIRKEGLDRVRISWGKDGIIESIRYYDAKGVNRAIKEGIFGYLWSNNYRYSLNQFGMPTEMGPYNTVDISYTPEKNVKLLKSKFIGDTNPIEAIDADGFSKYVEYGDSILCFRPGYTNPGRVISFIRDERGNIVERKTKADSSYNGPTYVRFQYDSKGYISEEMSLDENENPFGKKTDSIYMKQWSYFFDGTLKSEIFIACDMTTIHSYKVDSLDAFTKCERFDRDSLPQTIIRIDSAFDNRRSTLYFTSGNRPLNYTFSVGSYSFECHRKEVHIDGNKEISKFYYANGDEIIPMPSKTNDYTVETFFNYITEKDENGNLVSMQIKDSAGKILKSMKYFYQNGQQIGRAAMGVDGTPVRCPIWEEEGFGYYRIYVTKDFNDNFVGVSPVDEWHNPSVFNYDWINDQYRKVVFRNYKDQKIDVGFETIEIKNDYEQFVFVNPDNLSITQVAYLHILNKESPLYQKGFKDGDRLVCVGQWKYGEPFSKLKAEWNRKSIEITVLRPSDDSYITYKEYVNNTVYAEYHVMKTTLKEAEIFEKSLK